MNLSKKCSSKPFPFLVIDTTLVLHFRKNVLGRIFKVIMTTDHRIRDETLQYNIDIEETEILALSALLWKIDK